MASIDDLDVRNCSWHAMRVGELLEKFRTWKRTEGPNPEMKDFKELQGHFQSMETKCLLSFDDELLGELEAAILVNEGWENSAIITRIAINEQIASYAKKTTHYSDFKRPWEEKYAKERELGKGK